MPRVHMSAEARCRQLERLVRQHPGSTVVQLADLSAMGHKAARAYLQRLRREKRVEALVEEPATPRGALRHFYPFGELPQQKAAA